MIVTGAVLVTDGGLDAGMLPLLTLLAMAAFLPVSEIAHIGRQLADTLGATRPLGATRRLHAVEHEPVAVVSSCTPYGHKKLSPLNFPGQAR